jgi:hypothetical protein
LVAGSSPARPIRTASLEAVVVHQQPLEERLVPLAPEVPRRRQVGTVAVGQQVERLVEGVLGIGEGGLGDLDVALGLRGLGAEPILLGAQEVDLTMAPEDLAEVLRRLRSDAEAGLREGAHERLSREADEATRERYRFVLDTCDGLLHLLANLSEGPQ